MEKRRYMLQPVFDDLEMATRLYLKGQMTRDEYHSLLNSVVAFTGSYAAVAIKDDEYLWEDFLKEIIEWRNDTLNEQSTKVLK